LKLQRKRRIILASTLAYFLILVPLLLGVAFVTLLERKVLGLSQARKGPNKVRAVGLLQPFSDAVKLFTNQGPVPGQGSIALFLASPCLALSVVGLGWALITTREGAVSLKFRFILLIVVLSLGLYPLLLSGWSSNSKYAIVGAVRGVAQTISYEISLALVLLRLIMLGSSIEIGGAILLASRARLCAVSPLLMLI